MNLQQIIAASTSNRCMTRYLHLHIQIHRYTHTYIHELSLLFFLQIRAFFGMTRDFNVDVIVGARSSRVLRLIECVDIALLANLQYDI